VEPHPPVPAAAVPPHDPVTGQQLPQHLLDQAPDDPQPALALPAALAAVALGAAVGALARWLVSVVASPRPLLALVLINFVGCAAMGLLMVFVARLSARPGRSRWPLLVRPALATGVLGGFTTFSTFAVDVVALAEQGRWVAAGSYLGGTVVGCAVAVWAGQVVGLGVVVGHSQRRAGVPR
jgi:CrcB protein